MDIRLPTPGSDQGSWGDLLNAFLSVEHNADGTLKKEALINAAQQTSQKGQVNGYASLGNTGIVPPAQLPAMLPGVGDYIGVIASAQNIDPDTYTNVDYASITASRGSTLSWSSDNANAVVVGADGVYAINMMVQWGDEADTTGSYRWAQINAACGFYTQDRRPSVNSLPTPESTIQSLQLTVYLQEGQNIFTALNQGSSAPLTPDVLTLVTRVS